MQAPTVPSGRWRVPQRRASVPAPSRRPAPSASPPRARLGARRSQAVVDRRRLVAAGCRRDPHPPSHAAARRPPARASPSRRPRGPTRRSARAPPRAPARSRAARRTCTSAGSRRLSEFPVADRRAELNGMKMAQPAAVQGLWADSGGRSRSSSRVCWNTSSARRTTRRTSTPRMTGASPPSGATAAPRRPASPSARWTAGRALSSMGFVDERAADAAFYERADDGGYARSSRRGDQGGRREPGGGARRGRDGGGFDDGGGAGWGTAAVRAIGTRKRSRSPRKGRAHRRGARRGEAQSRAQS